MSKWLVHFIATCQTCGKEWSGQFDRDKAYYHAKKYKHDVHYETGCCGEWNFKGGKK